MRSKPYFTAARLTPRQRRKVEVVATANDMTLSGVISALIDAMELDEDLISGNANRGAKEFEPQRAAVAA